MVSQPFINQLRRSVALALLLSPAAALGEPSADTRVNVRNPENYCLGGIEDRKIIVDESQVANPFEETTRLGCQVDGGEPHTMPDLPTPTPEQRRLV